METTTVHEIGICGKVKRLKIIRGDVFETVTL